MEEEILSIEEFMELLHIGKNTAYKGCETWVQVKTVLLPQNNIQVGEEGVEEIHKQPITNLTIEGILLFCLVVWYLLFYS